MNITDQIRVAITVEWWKLRRSSVTWTTTGLMVLLIPLLSAAFYSLAIDGRTGTLAAKAEIFLSAPGWDGFLGMVGQIAAAAALVGVGVVVSWVFGREFAEATFKALFALPVGRRAIAIAKLLVLVGWVVVLAIGITAMTWTAGLFVLDEGSPSLGGFAELGAVVILTGLTGISVGLFASVGRGYLPGVGATILLITAAQVLVLFGIGGWFPPAVAGLIAVRGAPGIPTVSGIQIAAVPVVTIVVGAVLVWWWGRAESS